MPRGRYPPPTRLFFFSQFLACAWLHDLCGCTCLCLADVRPLQPQIPVTMGLTNEEAMRCTTFIIGLLWLKMTVNGFAQGTCGATRVL